MSCVNPILIFANAVTWLLLPLEKRPLQIVGLMNLATRIKERRHNKKMF